MNYETEEELLLLQRGAFGRQVEEFLATTIGQYLLERAKDEVREGYSEFRKVDPTNIKAVMQIQTKIFRAESFVGWLGDAVGDGLRALNLLDDRE